MVSQKLMLHLTPQPFLQRHRRHEPRLLDGGWQTASSHETCVPGLCSSARSPTGTPIATIIECRVNGIILGSTASQIGPQLNTAPANHIRQRMEDVLLRTSISIPFMRGEPESTSQSSSPPSYANPHEAFRAAVHQASRSGVPLQCESPCSPDTPEVHQRECD